MLIDFAGALAVDGCLTKAPCGGERAEPASRCNVVMSARMAPSCHSRSAYN